MKFGLVKKSIVEAHSNQNSNSDLMYCKIYHSWKYSTESSFFSKEFWSIFPMPVKGSIYCMGVRQMSLTIACRVLNRFEMLCRNNVYIPNKRIKPWKYFACFPNPYHPVLWPKKCPWIGLWIVWTFLLFFFVVIMVIFSNFSFVE